MTDAPFRTAPTSRARCGLSALVMELAETVHRARETAGLTQTELARRMGTTQSAVTAIE